MTSKTQENHAQPHSPLKRQGEDGDEIGNSDRFGKKRRLQERDRQYLDYVFVPQLQLPTPRKAAQNQARRLEVYVQVPPPPYQLPRTLANIALEERPMIYSRSSSMSLDHSPERFASPISDPEDGPAFLDSIKSLQLTQSASRSSSVSVGELPNRAMSPTPFLATEPGYRPHSRSVSAVLGLRPSSTLDDAKYYEPGESEIIEDGALHIYGEDSFLDDECLPVRNLSNFSFYDWKSMRLLPLNERYQSYGASGTVSPHFNDGDDHEDDEGEEDENSDEDTDSQAIGDSNTCDGQLVKLGMVKDFWLDKDYDDPRIWVRTDHSWYILDVPSKQYEPFYSPIFTVHFITYAVTSAVREDFFTTYQQFVKKLRGGSILPDASAFAAKILGRPLSADLLDRHELKPLIKLSVLNWSGFRRYKTAPLIKAIVSKSGPVSASESESDVGRSDNLVRSAHSIKKWRKRGERDGTVEKRKHELQVFKHRTETVVTHTVKIIAAGLFYRELVVAGLLDENKNDQDELALVCSGAPRIVHQQDPKTIWWGDPVLGQKHYYQSVYLDGNRFDIGDTVVVEAGEDEDKADFANANLKSSKTTNELGNRAWFCVIRYFYERPRRTLEKGSDRLFHGQWFAHGSKTLLAETASPQSLFIMNRCDDNPVSSILQKCSVRKLAPGEKEPIRVLADNIDCYHYSLLWNRHDLSFSDEDLEPSTLAQHFCESHKLCNSCAIEIDRDWQSNCQKSETAVSLRGTEYHLQDFVYVRNNHTRLLDIAQVVSLRLGDPSPSVDVHFMERYSSLPSSVIGGRDPHSEKCLFRSQTAKTIQVEELDGVCFVQHEDYLTDLYAWISLDNCFFVNERATCEKPRSQHDLTRLPAHEFSLCIACYDAHQSKMETELDFVQCNGKLRALELFAGAGGLSSGMELSGFIDTKWAVEFCAGAAKTYKENHPETVVYNEDTNQLLQHAMDCHSGKAPKPLVTPSGDAIPWMPQPGEVDIVMGGPPCQSFSGMNRYRKVDDIRHALIANMVSYVEFYRPKYFLLENVKGMLYFPLNGKQTGKKIVGGIDNGVVKFIVRSLICLGYQVHFKVLQAGRYGVPQRRERVIFLAARSGVPLPQFPDPTHVFTTLQQTRNISTVGVLRPISRSKKPEDDDPHQCAPMPAVTVLDAIDDLPQFDWENPHLILRATRAHLKEEKQRAQDIPVYNAQTRGRDTAQYSGFMNAAPYTHEANTAYQVTMRRGMGARGHRVLYQYTGLFSPGVVERTVNVPLVPDAGHSDLPKALRNVKTFSGSMIEKSQRNTYVRINGDAAFSTAMTNVNPSMKNGRVLHPNQKRVITVRECARAQGFPDTYEFLSINTNVRKVLQDQYRQIGNAVPVPLAIALGKAIGRAAVEMWLATECYDEGGDTQSDGRHLSVEY